MSVFCLLKRRDSEIASTKVKGTYGSIALYYGAGRRDAVFASDR